MPAVFFISDTHFGHAGVCQFLREDGTKMRPWDDVAQMDEHMARKNAQHYPETKNADGTVKATKPRRGTGPVPRPMKKVTGRGR